MHTTQPASLPRAPGLGPHVCAPLPVWTVGLVAWSPPAPSDCEQRRRCWCRGRRGHEVGRPRRAPRSLPRTVGVVILPDCGLGRRQATENHRL